MKHKRSRKEVKRDGQIHYEGLEAAAVDETAKANFNRKPYQSVDVTQYIAKKYGIGGGTDGQTNS